MLLLTRNIGESIFINDVEVTVVGVSGFQVKVGIDAPKDITILRAELYYQQNPDKKPDNWDDIQASKQAQKDRNKLKRSAQVVDNRGNK